ncbi:DUF3718 domain-containing protein [Colwellia sp. 1_MG-2023]|uniref:DUF3718 domain-containing protein n=1 Tax=Colwellia sp. 1_MG-2023 TaxID=3062649 RepID=UPI0026E13EDE|nr:DUF3718 domain-containing protein [Colwellia sp. 1_MG-2023]MDO6446790.1 DUF3718 domain-containing protein [Colwellia sp. 1_MG-2023]
MTKIILLASVLATSLLISAPAKADLSLRVCEYVQANDKNRLRSFLKANKLKIRKIYNGLMCNGSTLLAFAAKSQALEVGEFMIGKLPAKVVAAEIPEIAKYSAHLAEEAKER